MVKIRAAETKLQTLRLRYDSMPGDEVRNEIRIEVLTIHQAHPQLLGPDDFNYFGLTRKQLADILVELHQRFCSAMARLHKANLKLHTTRVLAEDQRKELSKALSIKNSQIRWLKRRVKKARRSNGNH